jgi:hypothetical protein
MKSPIGKSIIALSVGIALFALALYIYQGTLIDKSWKRVEAEITRSDTFTGGDPGPGQPDGTKGLDYRRWVGYRVDGRAYEGRINNAGSRAPHEVGERLQIAYNPSNPSEIKTVPSFRDLAAVYFWLPLMGVIFIGAGVWNFVKR